MKKIKIISSLDLTPMIDIAFLLLMSLAAIQYSYRENVVPSMFGYRENENGSPIGCYRKTVFLFLYLTKNDGLYYESSTYPPTYQRIDFSKSANLRPIIEKYKKNVAAKYGSGDSLRCIIKPLSDCRYKNIIDVMDELNINHVKLYTVASVGAREEAVIRKALCLKP